MRKRILTAALAGTLLIAPGFVPQARADHGWFSVGAGFRVGLAHIALVFGQPVGYGYGYGPAYYYRYDRPISYRGHHCSRYCYREGGYYYHHESCPLVHAHFRAYSVDPYSAYSRYAPRGGYGYRPYYDDYYSDSGYYGDDDYYGGGSYIYIDGYYRDGRYSRRYDGRYNRRYYDRYDRRYDGRYDRRYDRRHDGRYDRRYDGRHDGRYDRRHDGRHDRMDDRRHDRRYRDRDYRH
jgi:hypothetical protein